MSRREQDFAEWARTLDAHELARAQLESQPEWLERDPAEVATLAEAERLRSQAGANVNFARAKQTLDAGFWLVAVDTDGRLIPEFSATLDIAAAAAWWSTHPESIPAAATGADYGLYCLDVSHPRGGGPAWIMQACYEPPPADFDAGDFEDPLPRAPGWLRDPLAAPVRLSEPVPFSQPRLRGTRVAVGSKAIREATERLLRPRLAPPVRELWVWAYPQGWRLPKPGSRITADITVLGFVPLEGSRIRLGDRSWRVDTTLGRIQEMPSYLAEVLCGKRTPAPLPAQLQPAKVQIY